MIIRKYFALSIVAASLAIAGCSSSDDDEGDDGATTTGVTDAGGDDTGMGGDDTGMGGDDTGMGGDDTGAGGGPDPVMDMSTPTGNSILDLARGTDEDGDGTFEGGIDDLSSLVGALGAYPALLNILDDESQMLTVFAPNNDAFAAAQEAIAGMDAAGVENTLRYHVVVGQVIDPAALTQEDMDAISSEDGLTVTTAQGGTVTLSLAEGGDPVMVNDATVLASDSSAANGIVHIIDSVLAAPEAPTMGGDDGDEGDGGGMAPGGAAGSALAAIESDPNLSQFLQLVNDSNRRNALEATDAGNRAQVVFAPSNTAIDSSIESAVSYTYTGRTGAEGPLGPGSYTGFGDAGLTFNLAGSEDSLTVNGLPANFIETTSGPALYVFGEEYGDN